MISDNDAGRCKFGPPPAYRVKYDNIIISRTRERDFSRWYLSMKYGRYGRIQCYVWGIIRWVAARWVICKWRRVDANPLSRRRRTSAYNDAAPVSM